MRPLQNTLADGENIHVGAALNAALIRDGKTASGAGKDRAYKIRWPVVRTSIVGAAFNAALVRDGGTASGAGKDRAALNAAPTKYVGWW
jgi:hypothetical protein